MWLVSTGTVSGNLPFRLNPGEHLVGRSKAAQIVIKDLTVSKRHARLVCTTKSLVVEDLGSRNGTFVNEVPVERTPVQLGDKIRFGSVTCVLCPAAMMPVESVDSESTFAVPSPGSPTVGTEGLTPAQQEVLRLALRGLDDEAIAKELGRSSQTVHTHFKAIYKHFGVHTRVKLLAQLLGRTANS